MTFSSLSQMVGLLNDFSDTNTCKNTSAALKLLTHVILCIIFCICYVPSVATFASQSTKKFWWWDERKLKKMSWLKSLNQFTAKDFIPVLH